MRAFLRAQVFYKAVLGLHTNERSRRNRAASDLLSRPMLIGYARVSAGQTVALQQDALTRRAAPNSSPTRHQGAAQHVACQSSAG